MHESIFTPRAKILLDAAIKLEPYDKNAASRLVDIAQEKSMIQLQWPINPMSVIKVTLT